MRLEVCAQIWNILILLLDHNASWHKHVMEKHVLSDQTGFLSGQNLSLAGQMTGLLTNLFVCLTGSSQRNAPFLCLIFVFNHSYLLSGIKFLSSICLHFVNTTLDFN